MLWHPKTLQNLAMHNVFFHFWPFFHCRKATKMTQNSISIPSCAQTPKNPRKMSKTPPYSGLGAKPFLPPPPAKADIATANVIEHLVLLLPPNKHAFTAKAAWADLMRYLPAIKHGVLENHPFRSMVISVTSIEFGDFPATFEGYCGSDTKLSWEDVVRSWVRRELRS